MNHPETRSYSFPCPLETVFLTPNLQFNDQCREFCGFEGWGEECCLALQLFLRLENPCFINAKCSLFHTREGGKSKPHLQAWPITRTYLD